MRARGGRPRGLRVGEAAGARGRHRCLLPTKASRAPQSGHRSSASVGISLFLKERGKSLHLVTRLGPFDRQPGRRLGRFCSGAHDRYGDHWCDWIARGVHVPMGDRLQLWVTEANGRACRKELLARRGGRIAHLTQQKVERHLLAFNGFYGRRLLVDGGMGRTLRDERSG